MYIIINSVKRFHQLDDNKWAKNDLVKCHQTSFVIVSHFLQVVGINYISTYLVLAYK